MPYKCMGCNVVVPSSECPRCGSELPEIIVKAKVKRKTKNNIEGLVLTGSRPVFPVENYIIVARDPGNSSGCSALYLNNECVQRTYGRHVITTPTICWIDTKGTSEIPFNWRTCAIVTEGQWLKGDAKKRNGILSLCAASNRWLGMTCYKRSEPGYILPVDVWKYLILDGRNTDRYVHCKRIKKLLLPHEIDRLPSGPAEHDALSSIGILFAAYLLRFDINKFRVI